MKIDEQRKKSIVTEASQAELQVFIYGGKFR